MIAVSLLEERSVLLAQPMDISRDEFIIVILPPQTIQTMRW